MSSTYEGSRGRVTWPLPCVTRLSRGASATSPQGVRNACIALHGFGDTAQNFASLVDELPVDDMLWVMPHAPDPVPMSVDGGQWYNLFGPARPDVERSFDLISKLIGSVEQATGLGVEKIFLLGFSQGAYMTLYSGLRLPRPPAGLIAMSGYMGQTHRLPALSDSHRNTPIYLAHGLADQVVLPAMHYETLDILESLAFKSVEARVFHVGHGVHPDELRDVTRFIEAHR